MSAMNCIGQIDLLSFPFKFGIKITRIDIKIYHFYFKIVRKFEAFIAYVKYLVVDL